MLAVFSSIFVVHTKIISRCNFVAPNKINLTLVNLINEKTYAKVITLQN